MKAFPILKVLTVVVVTVTSGLAIALPTATITDSQSESTNCAGYENASQCTTWQTEAKNKKAKEDNKELVGNCRTAFDSYSDLAAKEKTACEAFTSSGTTCKQKLSSCKSIIGGLATGSGEGEDGTQPPETSGMGAMLGVANLAINQKLGISSGTNGIAGCVSSIDREAMARKAQEIAQKRQELADKIKQQKDDIVKYKEEINKERNEANEKTAEIEAQNTKDKLDRDKKTSEKSAELSKSAIEVGKRMRGYSLAVTKELQNLANANFEYETAMLELSDEKISQKCSQEFESLKAGLVNSRLAGAPSGASAEEQKQYAALAALAAQYKAKGIRGTGELKAMLISAKKACYERANTSRNKNKMVNSQTVKNIQDKVDEYKNLMVDEKKNVAADQETLKTLKEQAEKDGNAAETEKLTKLQNLNSKLTDLATTTAEKTKAAEDKIKELTAEIQDLTVTKNFEVKGNFEAASEAITKGVAAQAKAYSSCNCGATPVPASAATGGGTAEMCSILAKDKKDYDGTKIPTAPVKAPVAEPKQ